MREFTEQDIVQAQILASRLGYVQTAYTSTSDLTGLFCMPENPEYANGYPDKGGCIIASEEFGIMFVQTAEDITGEI